VLLLAEAIAVLRQPTALSVRAIIPAVAFCLATVACVWGATAAGTAAIRGSAALVLGMLMACIALIIRILSRQELGLSFTYDIREPVGGSLVTANLYSIVRHPAYLATHLGLIAVGLLMGTWLGIALSCAGLPLTLSRIRREDRLLEERFGDSFRAYRARTKALVPFVY
jgi:protein-S-isoprenylcysteine O-methyltransferase Ste14